MTSTPAASLPSVPLRMVPVTVPAEAVGLDTKRRAAKAKAAIKAREKRTRGTHASRSWGRAVCLYETFSRCGSGASIRARRMGHPGKRKLQIPRADETGPRDDNAPLLFANCIG